MKARIIALILIAALCLACFTGCGSDNKPTENASGTDISTENDANAGETADTPDDGEPLTYSTFDYTAAYNSYEPDAVVLTVNGDEITWAEYFGWLYSMMEQYEMYLGTEFEWTDPFSETQTIEEYTKYYAETMCSQYAVVNGLAKEKGLELNEEEKQYIEDLLLSDAENYANGSVEDFIKYLEATFMSEEYYRFINTVAIYYQKLFTTLFGENGETMTNEDVEDFIESNGYLYAKHILYLTTDEAGEALDENAKAEKLAAAEAAVAQLKGLSGDALIEKFDEIMMAESEDSGLASYPDGYYFLPGEMVSEFEEGTKALEYNTVSDIIESAYGYHIILRLPISPESEYSEGYNFRYLAASYAYDTMMGEAFEKAEIVYSDDFASLSLGDIFTTVELEY